MINVGTNSYVDLEYADKYFSERLNAEKWISSIVEQKSQALVTATKKIDRQIFTGMKADLSQKLQFPRKYYSYSIGQLVTQITVPDEVKNAVCEESLALLQFGNSKRVKLQQEGVTSMSLGNMSESYSCKIKKILSDEARELIQAFLGSVNIC